ncbi:hypothetical protein GLOTRDRAFT_132258 [Gloeophyllum trabeum ATCC 11539]|uniref:Uncharacterized protein n=1 Tax=Gloeophyllum trabeum (strain ATCC 11539 / FP-39264 / Madison 617) TaxID=670483 RepID=S7PXT9_GLOTA|nr:uncharacterized protein GLOTRDRAFT_132258 [Gloeophyllum trabeum ATCC 11539]EPQ52142.1 hypothetical protein GLOTRDRAFT_132258 [Gloeophyllum trabeum ATCC 11539]
MSSQNQKTSDGQTVEKVVYPETKQPNGMPAYTRAWVEGWTWMPGSNCGVWSVGKEKVEVYESVQEHKSNKNNHPPSAEWRFIGLS